MSAELPLAYQQRWLWDLLQQHRHWNCVVTQAFRVIGPLSVETLQRCVEEVCRRHGALRTRIVAVADQVHQCVDQPDRFSIDRRMVAGESEAQQALAEFCQQPTDPKSHSLMRMQLLQLSAQEHWLLLAMHRLIADCASIDRVVDEMWTLYGQSRQGQDAGFDSDAIQYGDYARWQAETSARWVQRHERYWQDRLREARPLIWPADGQAMHAAPGTLGRMHTWIDEELAAGLRELGRRSQTLAATTMFAVFVAVLWKWCRQTDFVLPFKVAGRKSEYKSVVGYFPNLLYVRIVMTGNETFRELLGTVAAECFQALSHQDYGRTATQDTRFLAGAFFQWITWRHGAGSGDVPPAEASRTGLAVERIEIRKFGDGLTAIPPGVVNAELTCFDTGDGIYASGVYRADLFSAATMDRFMSDLRAAMARFIGNPEARVDSF